MADWSQASLNCSSIEIIRCARIAVKLVAMLRSRPSPALRFGRRGVRSGDFPQLTRGARGSSRRERLALNARIRRDRYKLALHRKPRGWLVRDYENESLTYELARRIIICANK